MARPIEVEDVVRIARLSDLRVSSRGSAAFILTRSDVERNESRTTLTIIEKGAEIYLDGKDYSMPRWSPSGRLLTFQGRRDARRGDKGAGLYIWGGAGEPRLVAWFKHGISGVEWVNDDEIAVISPVPRRELYDEDGDYVIADELPLWFDGSGFVSALRNQLHLVDAHSGATRLEFIEPNGVRGVAACGDAIYYYVPTGWSEPHIHALKAYRGGVVEELARGYSISDIKCVDGDLYVIAHKLERGLSSHYRLYVLEDGSLRCVTCGLLDREISRVGGSYEGGVVISYLDSGRTPIARVIDGSLEVVLEDDMYVYDVDSNGRDLFMIASTPNTPIEVYKYEDGGVKKVTRVNEWFKRKYNLVTPRRVEVRVGGDTVEGWVLLPPIEGKKPLILYIHGGPKAMYGYAFYPEMQLMASRGFVVAYSNPRGSSGYSEEFADIRGRYGRDDYEQLMAFLNRVLEEYGDEVDRDRMAVTGISYGGYMTNVIITRNKMFKAAISENGIADWISDFWASDIGYWFDPDQIGGNPLDNLDNYVDKSPVFKASNVDTPVMLIHSMEDYRCFIDQALAMHVALKMHGKESRLVVFTKGSHGHSIRAEPRHRVKRLKLILSWLDEKIGLPKHRKPEEQRQSDPSREETL